jgi:hypothetical protein
MQSLLVETHRYDQSSNNISDRLHQVSTASPQTDHYIVCGLLNSYVQLVRHHWLPEDLDHTNDDSAMGVDEYRTHRTNELLDVLNLFVLANCLHCLLAHHLSDPYLPISLHDLPLPPWPSDAL